MLVDRWDNAHERAGRVQNAGHENNTGLMHCRQPVTLRNVQTSLTVVEMECFQ